MNVSPTAFLLFIVKRKVEKMAEEKNEELKEETKNEEVKDEKVENETDNREEETSDEIRDNVYANDDIIEMLKSVEKRLDSFDEKLENVLSMSVDSGAIIHDSVDDVVENSARNYAEDFIDIDDLDLSL